MNRLRFISQVVYRLKRRYGEQAYVVKRRVSTVDLETGKKVVKNDSLSVSRVIVLPSVVHREFVYDLTFIATNKNFTYGGTFDTSERRFIIDRKDLGGLVITPGMYLIFKNRRYECKQVEEFEDDTAYFIVGKALNDIDVQTIHELNMGDDIIIGDGGTHE